MNAHLTIPRSSIILETYNVPRIGNLIHRIGFGIARVYNEMALCFVGFAEMVENKQINPDENDLKALNHFKVLFELLLKYNPNPSNKNFQFVIHCAEISLQAINKVFELQEERSNYKVFKKQMFDASSKAIVKNLKKYNEPIYEN